VAGSLGVFGDFGDFWDMKGIFGCISMCKGSVEWDCCG